MSKSRVGLSDSLDSYDFEYIERGFRAHYELPLETMDLDAVPVAERCSDRCNPDFCDLIMSTESGKNRCRQDRLRSLTMAFEIGQPYETLCHAGLFLVCVPIMQREHPLGGFFFGKCLSARFEDEAFADFAGRVLGLDVDPVRLRAAAETLPVLEARMIHQASEYLFILLYERTQLDPRIIEWRSFKAEQQARIGEIIQERKTSGGSNRYPFDREQELIAKVKAGDRVGAKEILNRILGSILFKSPGKIDILKARLVELLSILSRGAAEAGTDIEPLLEKNVGYINKVISLNTQDEICAWISIALDDFIENVYQQQEPLSRDRIDLAQKYISDNYAGRVTVKDVAKAANLSESRLSHLFRDQLGTTVMDYLLTMRTSRAKTLLLTSSKTCIEIAYETGFNDPSYFTRSFRSRAGVSPSVYRKLHPDG
ncbi:MAG: helix-turn-helix domain-containing protein [Spirochaetales bacterium]|nr:helix-turn-helix domain-containing protein [Spirochaetales bacterium]